MKHRRKSILQWICILSGLGLLAAACVILAPFLQNPPDVQTLRFLMPEPRPAALEERRDNTMGALSLDGTDFIGILEFPLFDAALPVGADWGDPIRCPRRLSGSIYDGTIQIGGTSRTGQFDFFRQISVGDELFFTDMEGNCYSLTVTDLRYAKHADQASLQRKEAALTLFIKNVYAFEYLIVSCNVPN